MNNTTIPAAQTRLTTHRQAVLDAVAMLPHPTAADVYDRVRGHRSRIAIGTVYNALHYLVEHGYVAQVRRPDGVVSYDRETTPHDHAICYSCGRLADVPGHTPTVYARVERETGFTIEGHRVEFLGRCPACRAGTDREEPGL